MKKRFVIRAFAAALLLFVALTMPAGARAQDEDEGPMASVKVVVVRDASGKPNPYRRRFVVLAPGQPGNPSAPGVHVQSIQQDMSPLPKRYEPGNPDADKDGYIKTPNVDMAVEMVNAIEASRAYEANVTLMDTAKSMFNSSLRLLA